MGARILTHWTTRQSLSCYLKFYDLRTCSLDINGNVAATEGLTEEHVVPFGEEFGEERFMEALSKGRGLLPEDMIDEAVRAASAFVGGTPFEDDVCVLAVECAGEGD